MGHTKTIADIPVLAATRRHSQLAAMPDTATPCRLLPDLTADGPRQMALDEALLECASHPVLRFYAWDPACVSLGCFQEHAAIAAALPPGMPVVRRITGGGAIWHEHEVTYALAGTLGRDGLPERTRGLYAPLHHAVLAAIHRRGGRLAAQPSADGDRRYRDEPRCFASPAVDDLIAPGAGKVLGSAARARGDRMLLHGSLKLASNPWDGAVTAPCGLAPNAAREALAEGVATAFGWRLEPGSWRAEEEEAAARILAARYGDRAWIEMRRGPRP